MRRPAVDRQISCVQTQMLLCLTDAADPLWRPCALASLRLSKMCQRWRRFCSECVIQSAGLRDPSGPLKGLLLQARQPAGHLTRGPSPANRLMHDLHQPFTSCSLQGDRLHKLTRMQSSLRVPPDRGCRRALSVPTRSLESCPCCHDRQVPPSAVCPECRQRNVFQGAILLKKLGDTIAHRRAVQLTAGPINSLATVLRSHSWQVPTLPWSPEVAAHREALRAFFAL